MKKILGLTIAALLVMALVGGGTWAYFSDVETSSGNVFSAGTLDLNIEGGNTDVTMLTLSDIKPGDDDAGVPGTVNLKNIGSIIGNLTVATAAVTETESTGTTGTADAGGSDITMIDDALIEAEDYWVGYYLEFTSGSNIGEERIVTDFAAGTDTITVASAFTNAVAASDAYSLHTEHELDVITGVDIGELGAEVDLVLWLDVGGVAGVYDVGTDKRLDPDGTVYTTAQVFYPMANYGSKTWTDCVTGLATGNSIDFYVEWDFTNELAIDQSAAQGDSASIDFTFTLNQP